MRGLRSLRPRLGMPYLLLATIDGILGAGSVVREHLRLPYGEGRVLAVLGRRVRVLDRRYGDAAVEDAAVEV